MKKYPPFLKLGTPLIMFGFLIAFNTDGSIRCVSSKKPGQQQLKQLYSLIDTTIVESMPILEELQIKDMTLYTDETGVLKKKVFNPFVQFLIYPATFDFLKKYGSPAGVCVLEVPQKEDMETILNLAKKDKELYKKLNKAMKRL